MADPVTASLPDDGGAYALYFELSAPVVLPIARLRNPVLDPGTYVYAGSAYGPGGIRARVARHLRSDKNPHWHVDHLTARVAAARVETFPGGMECDLVTDLLAAGGDTPVPGFGSSDCKTCTAHLVRLAGE
ncbi:MAG: GIY-YIG nuclease family protein [Alphaproteobacteria bacterium]